MTDDGAPRGRGSLLLWITFFLTLLALGLGFLALRAQRRNQAALERLHELELQVETMEEQLFLSTEPRRAAGGAPTARPPAATPRPRPTQGVRP